MSGLLLGWWNCLQSTAHVFCDVRRGEEGKGQNRPQHPVDLEPRGQKQGDQQLPEEQHSDQRHGPHQFDVGHARPAQHRKGTAAAKGQQHTQGQSQQTATDGQQQREAESAPVACSHRHQAKTAGQEPQAQRGHGEPGDRQRLSPDSLTGTHQGEQCQNDQSCDPDQRPPALIGRVAADPIERQVAGHHRPVSTVEEPVQDRPATPAQQGNQRECDQAIEPAGHQRLLRRRPRTNPLNAVMVPLINRFSSRKLSTNSRKPSMALPVWVMVVSLTA